MAITQAQTDTRTKWELDPTHTLVEFGVKHMMVTTVRGRFAGVRGTLLADEARPENSEFDAEIDAGTIDTRNDQRDAHLRSADFLDADNFPTITFRSTRVDVLNEDRLRVVGDLTIRGVTQEVELDTTVNGRGKTPFGTEVVGLSAATSIRRKDFGLEWNVALDTGGWLVGEEVKITLEVEAVKQD
jgi:polyisoprenoid-binding protein YceI